MNAPATNFARPASFDRGAQHRRAMLAKINVARHQLNMVEDDYRQLLFDATGKTSLKECSEAEMDAVLTRLKGLGFKPVPKKGERSAQHPMARKARALWISLHQLGVVHNPSEQALEAFARRQLGCDRLVWARQSDAYRLIEALKDMASRNGWSQTGASSPRELQHSLCEAILQRLKDRAAIPADWTIDIAAFRLCGIETGATEGGYGAEDYARLAGALGARLREIPTEGAVS